MGLVDDKAYDLEKRLNALMGRVGLVDGGGNPETVSGNGWTANTSSSRLAGIAGISALNTTVLTSAGFTSVPGGDVQAGTSYDIHASGSYATGASAPSGITLGIYWGGIGGTAIATLSPPGPIGTNLSGVNWYLDAEVNWRSATEVQVTLVVGWRNASGVGNSTFLYVVTDTTGLSTTGSENLSVGVQWGSAPTGTSFNCDICRIGRVA